MAVTFMLTCFMVVNVGAASATEGKIIQVVKETETTVDVEVKIAGATEHINNVTLYIPYDTNALTFDAASVVEFEPFKSWEAATKAAAANTNPKSVKFSYATTNTATSGSNVSALKLGVGEEKTVTTFSFKKNATGSIAECPTTFGVVKNGPASAYSVVSTIGKLADFSNNPTSGTPNLFTIDYTPMPTSVDVTGLKVAKNSVALTVGGSETVGVTIEPEDATDKTYRAVSNADDVATVQTTSTGVEISAVAEGTAKITVTSVNNANAKAEITVNVTKPAPTNYTVSVNNPANGIATINKTTVEAGGMVNLKVRPAIGYVVKSVMMNSADITTDFDAAKGGVIQYTINENTDFVVTFEASAVADVPFIAPEAFVGNYQKPGTIGEQKSAATFGKIVVPGGKTLKTYGVKLEKDGVAFTKVISGKTYGPEFEASSKQGDLFGVLFIGLESGVYTATTYVTYADGSSIEGQSVEFTVQ